MLSYLFDGAFGTYFHQLYPEISSCEICNVTDRGAVLSVHRAYIAAGCNAILTNTFSAYRPVFGEQTGEILRSGVGIAQEAAGDCATVFADLGPLDAESDVAVIETLWNVDRFIELGVTHFALETQDDLSVVDACVRHIRERCSKAEILVSFAVSPDGQSRTGKDHRSLLAAAKHAGADIVGLNCRCGPLHMAKLLHDCKDLSPLCAMPNAGYPQREGGRTVYRDNPAYYASLLSEMEKDGISVLGGCCGTTPEHILAFVRRSNAAPAGSKPAMRFETVPSNPILKGKTVLAELSPPSDINVSPFFSAGEEFSAAGADMITVPDSPLARPRADSLSLAGMLSRRLNGVPVLPHLTCRDRNAIGMQSAMLAAHISGIRNVLCVMGDRVPRSDHGGSVYDFNTCELLSFLQGLNASLFSDAPYSLHAALNINAVNFKAELDRALRKEEAGASAFLTQSYFEPRALENIRLAREKLHAKLYVGILPPSSYKNALFLHNEVPGITIPQELLDGLEGTDRSSAAAVSLNWCRNLMDSASACCDGYYLMTPVRRTDLTLSLISYVKG